MEYKSAHQILTELRSGNYKPVYLLHGEEPYFIDQVSDYIEKNVLDESGKAFNLSILYGREVDQKQILDHARQFPMMAAHRVVIIKEARFLKDLAKLGSYIEQPAEQTILVIAHKDKNIDGRIAWVKKAKKSNHVAILKSEAIKDWKIEAWVSSYINQSGLQISPQANQLLCQSLGTDLKKITNEIAKVRLNIKGSEIVIDDVTRHIGISKEYNVFELIKAISYRDIARMQYIASQMESNYKKEPLVKFLPLIGTFVEKSLVAVQHQRTDDRKLSGMIGVHPTFVKDYKSAARNYGEQGLRRMHKLVVEADGRNKGVQYRRGDQGVLKELIGRMILA